MSRPPAAARLWHPATRKRRRTLTGHTRAVHAVAFSLDGRLLAIASADETARLWIRLQIHKSSSAMHGVISTSIRANEPA
jgi:WD40 repeat protein